MTNLNPGDVVYLPAHWVHKASAGPTGSLHLTITPKTQEYRCDKLLDSVLEVLPTYMRVGLCRTAAMQVTLAALASSGHLRSLF